MAPADGVPAGEALSGDLPRASFKEVVEDVGVPWPGDADCCAWEMPREAGLWDEELEESFFFEDLLASFARDNCSCYISRNTKKSASVRVEQGGSRWWGRGDDRRKGDRAV